MKNNLKTFPNLSELSEEDIEYFDALQRYFHISQRWKEDFEAELLELLLVAKLKPKEDIFAKAVEYLIEKEILGD